MSQSVMSNRFSQVPSAEIPRSSFNRSHGLKTTLDAGLLVPIFVDEALPGDTLNLKMTGFGRMATPIKPVMDNLFMETFFFAIPNRLIWENWQRFNGEQDDPGDSTDYLVPTQTSPAVTGYDVGGLGDYFGIPTSVPDLEHSALWHRAYNLCYNEFFRDQNLQNSQPVEKGDTHTFHDTVLRRGKRHDYFTSALPWPQKDNGNPVLLPLGSRADVWLDDTNDTSYPLTLTGVLESTGIETGFEEDASAPNDIIATGTRVGGMAMYADLTSATAATINELRQAFQVQRMFERDARGGTRYTEILKSHFGVTSPDARLQRPEFLGGGSSPINIQPVPQTSQTDTSVQGNLSAYGTVSLNNHGFTKSFTEHCVIIGLVNVRADLTYQHGLDRMWSRQTRFDYYWPALAQIGEQAVLNKEIYAEGSANPTGDEDVFGYQERYAEYRYKQSKITGAFRSIETTSLDAWHLAQEFGSTPVLGNTFIQDVPPIDRVIAVPAEPHFLFDAYFNYNCARPMPVYGVPGMIDHF